MKDAFLCVEQQEEMFVVIPQWIRDLSPEDKSTVWRLKHCLPGQRNAALRWFEYFSNLCQSAGMESYKGCPTIMKLVNSERRVYLSVHVDDVLLVGNEKDLEWFKKEVASGLMIKVDGPHHKVQVTRCFTSRSVLHFCLRGFCCSPMVPIFPSSSTC